MSARAVDPAAALPALVRDHGILDVWQRTPAGWRISQRELVMTWTDGDPRVLVRPTSAG